MPDPEPIQAKGTAPGAKKANATRKTAAADSSSTDAHEASAKAHDTDAPDDHKAAADAHQKAYDKHETAYKANAKAGNDDAMDHHMAAMSGHKAMVGVHSDGDDDDDDAKAKGGATNGIVHCEGSSATFEETPTGELQWMPGGVTTVTANYDGKPIQLTVQCTQDSARTVADSFERCIKASPRRPPYGCVEHREEEAAFHPKGFTWKDQPEPGIYCSAEWTTLGLRNVRGKIHTSFSPSFATDAEYTKGSLRDGVLTFPDGVKGSESNPANITGVSHKSVGSLTNWPAFKNILPVRAKQAEPQPETTNAGQITGLKMRVKLLKARGSNTAGTYLELEDNDAVKAVASGEAMPEHAAQAIEARDAELVTIKAKQTESDKSRIVEAIDRGVKRGALLPKGTDAKSQETIKATQFDRLLKGADVNLLIEMLDNMPQVTNPEGLTGRRIQAENGSVDKHVFGGEPTAAEVVEKIISASGKDRIGSAIGACHRPLSLQQGGSSLSDIQAAAAESLDNARLLKAHVLDAYNKQGDWALRQMVRAISDVTDPNTQVGTLSSTLVLMRNLGYLKNKLNFMPYISTDLRAEPARYGQSVLTRYITPPNVLTYVPGTGYTSDATAISNYIANLGTNKANIGTSVSGVAADVAGTHTLSAPSTTDVPVIINNHTGVEIRFPTSTIGATVRNLFAEQQGAQMYSLAEFINKVFLATVFSATWNGISATALPLGGNTFGLSGVVKIKNKFSINKMPDTGRFAVLHSVYHDNILTDASLLTAKAILAVNGGESDFETGELPTLFGIKVLESQLAAYKSAGSVAAAFTGLVTPTDPTTIAAVAPDGIGFAGNSASALFVARLPQDYTTVLPNIPATAAIEIVTEPDSGLSLLFTKYVDHSLAEVKARCAIMFGFAQGDPRQGFVLTP